MVVEHGDLRARLVLVVIMRVHDVAVRDVFHRAGVTADRMVLDHRQIDDRGGVGEEATIRGLYTVPDLDVWHLLVVVVVRAGLDAGWQLPVTYADARAGQEVRKLFVDGDLVGRNAERDQ